MSSASSVDEKGKDYLQDPVAAAVEPKQYAPIVTEPLGDTEKDLEANAQKSTEDRVILSRFNSSATEASEDTLDTKSSVKRKKKWYQKLDPFRWGPDPPVPETRQVSREYQAGILSRLTFQWMHPLMTVSVTFGLLILSCRSSLIRQRYRSDTDVHSSTMTFGQSTRIAAPMFWSRDWRRLSRGGRIAATRDRF